MGQPGAETGRERRKRCDAPEGIILVTRSWSAGRAPCPPLRRTAGPQQGCNAVSRPWRGSAERALRLRQKGEPAQEAEEARRPCGSRARVRPRCPARGVANERGRAGDGASAPNMLQLAAENDVHFCDSRHQCRARPRQDVHSCCLFQRCEPLRATVGGAGRLERYQTSQVRRVQPHIGNEGHQGACVARLAPPPQ